MRSLSRSEWPSTLVCCFRPVLGCRHRRVLPGVSISLIFEDPSWHETHHVAQASFKQTHKAPLGVFEAGLLCGPARSWNLRSSCFSFLHGGIPGVCHHSQLQLTADRCFCFKLTKGLWQFVCGKFSFRRENILTILAFLVLFFLVLDKVLLSRPGRPGAYRDMPASASQVLELKGAPPWGLSSIVHLRSFAYEVITKFKYMELSDCC